MSVLSEALGQAGSRVGGAAGGVAGSGVGGLLGQVGDVLSAPRRKLWSLLGAPEHGNELVSQLTGMDKDSGLAHVLGTGAEILGDPLTYAGGLGGLLKGAVLGSRVGKALETAALVRGPNYAGGAEKLTNLALPATMGAAEDAGRLAALAKGPNASRILGEVPQGSTFLGSGAEGIALKTPAGDVLRFGDNLGSLPPPRVRDPLMLQPTRDVAIGNVRAERLPFADVADAGSGRLSPRDYLNMRRQMGGMEQQLESRGLRATDLHSGNVGMVGGEAKIIDPGAVESMTGAIPPEALPMRAPGPMQNALLRMLGSDKLVQDELARRAAAIPTSPTLSFPTRSFAPSLATGTAY